MPVTIQSYTHFLSWWERLSSAQSATFRYAVRVLSITAARLYGTAQWCVCVLTGNVYLWILFACLAPTPHTSDNHQSVLCTYEFMAFCFLEFHMKVRSYANCLSNLFFLKNLSFLKPFLLCFIRLFLLLAILCSMWNLSSPTRDQTHVLCTGSMASSPLDHGGSPCLTYFTWHNPLNVLKVYPSHPKQQDCYKRWCLFEMNFTCCNQLGPLY